MDSKKTEYGKFTMSDLEDIINELSDNGRRDLKEKIKTAKNNIKHLDRRSKELGKPVPPELMVYLGSPITHYVGGDFIVKYREWLQDDSEKQKWYENELKLAESPRGKNIILLIGVC